MLEFEDLNEQLKQYIHEETMCEMSNFRKRITKLPVNLSLQIATDEDKQYAHKLPRLKFQNNTSDSVTSLADLIPVSIDKENPQVLIDKPYNKKIFKQVKKWIILNYDALMEFWNQEIDEFELRDKLKTLS